MVKLRPERKEDKSGWPWAFKELWFVLKVRWARLTAEQRPALPIGEPGEAAGQKGEGLERAGCEG